MEIRERIEARLFEIVRSIELDVRLADDLFTLRIEMLQSRSNPTLFRARFLRSGYFRIQSTYPQTDDGKPVRAPADESFPVEWLRFPISDFNTFTAADLDAAERHVLDELASFLTRHGGTVG